MSKRIKMLAPAFNCLCANRGVDAKRIKMLAPASVYVLIHPGVGG